VPFQAYLDNIHSKTGKRADDFRRLATEKGFAEAGKLKPGVKAASATLHRTRAMSRGYA